MQTLSCPLCAAALSLEDPQSDTTITCPQCQGEFQVTLGTPPTVIPCPSCGMEMSVSQDLLNQAIQCPHCSHPFNPSGESVARALPEKAPFFKWQRRRVLEEQFRDLMQDGALSPSDEKSIVYAAARLGLSEADAKKILQELFKAELDPIKQRIDETAYLSADDLLKLKALERKFGAKIDLDADVYLCRDRFLLDERGQLPPPISDTSILLQGKEMAYFQLRCAWGQVRRIRDGYIGGSTRIRLMKGVSFSVGRAQAVSHEEIVPLGDGILYVTSKKVLFVGAGQNTSLALGRIVDMTVFKDAIRFDKERGKDDYFFMSAFYAAYVRSLVAALCRDR